MCTAEKLTLKNVRRKWHHNLSIRLMYQRWYILGFSSLVSYLYKPVLTDQKPQLQEKLHRITKGKTAWLPGMITTEPADSGSSGVVRKKRIWEHSWSILYSKSHCMLNWVSCLYQVFVFRWSSIAVKSITAQTVTLTHSFGEDVLVQHNSWLQFHGLHPPKEADPELGHKVFTSLIPSL